jgi:hypothetical protein
MNLTADDKKKAIAVGVFVLIAVGVLYYEVGDTFSSPAPVASPIAASTVAVGRTSPAGAPAGKAAAGSSSAQLDPTLKMGPMLVTEALVYSGGGRNIFSAASAPVEIPKAMAQARPKGGAPVHSPPPGPPPPPPIDLKFFGTATSGNGTRQAFLLHGEDVFLASAGDIVQRRYKIVAVAANSIVVEDMTNNNRQTLPLLTN